MDTVGRVSDEVDVGTAWVGIEFVVEDLDRAVALWVEVLGFEVATSGRSTAVPGQMAIVTDGRVAITLIEPDAVGPGDLLADRTPRVTQVVLTADDVVRCGETASEAGLSVVPTSTGFYLAPEAVAGALGIEVAVVVTGAGGLGAAPDADQPG